MIKIAFHINTFLVGGIEKTLIQQLSFFRPPQYDVTLVVTYAMGPLEVLRAEIPTYVKVKYLIESPRLLWTKRLKVQGKLPRSLKIYDELLQPLRKKQQLSAIKGLLSSTDVIVDFDLTLGYALKNIPCKKIGWLHFSPDHYHRGNPRKLQRLGEKLNQYDQIVMISDAMLDRARTIYPHLQRKLIRIYNSLDREILYTKKNDFSEILPPERALLKRPYIFSAARLEETQKDFTTLLKAYALILWKVSQDLVIAGDGRHKTQLEELAKDLGISHRVHFLGFKKNCYVWLDNCDVFVLSSHFEGLPTVLIEALMFHKKLVATDCPTGPREILNDGKCGQLVPVKNPEKMAEALLAACTGSLPLNEELLELHSRNFEKSTIFKILKEVYQPSA